MAVPQIRPIRQADIDGVTLRQGTKPCITCGRSTREGKPYCSEHIEHMDFARGVMDEVAARDHEIELARRGAWEQIDPKGGNAREVLMHLAIHGPRTVHRISRDVFIGANIRVAYSFADALEYVGYVAVGKTRRASPVLSITKLGLQVLGKRDFARLAE